MRIRTEIVQTGKTATGMRVPGEIVLALGAGKRPPVTVTIKGFTYRSTVAVYGGEFWVGVSADVRQAAGLSAGEVVDVDLDLDAAPRTIDVPGDLAAALEAAPEARATFDRLSYSNRSWHVLQVDGARTPETRRRRIAKSVDALRDGRPR